MKIRAATTDGIVSTSAYSELTFEVLWKSVCWFVVPTMLTTYPDLRTSVFGPTVTASQLVMENTPYPGTDCGAYEYKIIWPL